MEYRKLPHGDEQISIIGLGNSSLGALGEAEAEKAVAMAVENGINYFDMVGGDATPRLWPGCFRLPGQSVLSGSFWCGLPQREIWLDAGLGRNQALD